ncbi:hypothetical protein AMV030 [Betaentomopoxvirus amoorei]|uniref:AMV030 n=1 Tax=Amsacta moorei entomopoxvirus TaxID=28321 RepID=Q9EN18_AMEPV|nr:hypothetical protein AMV030 [Amsacta moorei entomopoxvirus]AAG02736.1 AMV030 [Amsacta moorei entomopoxvirus]
MTKPTQTLTKTKKLNFVINKIRKKIEINKQKQNFINTYNVNLYNELLHNILSKTNIIRRNKKELCHHVTLYILCSKYFINYISLFPHDQCKQYLEKYKFNNLVELFTFIYNLYTLDIKKLVLMYDNSHYYRGYINYLKNLSLQL